MALSNIALTGGMRANLLSLQESADLFDATQNRLATGKKVNNALDDPISYFAAKTYMDRASDLSNLKNNMNEAIQIIKAADAGTTAIADLIAQAKSLGNSALGTASTTERSSYAAQFDILRTQITDLAEDSSYKGTNLLQNGTLTVQFNEANTNTLSITGFSADSTGLSINAAITNWAATADINTAMTALDTASTTLRTQTKSMSNRLAIINTRLEFTSNMISTLQKGADNLTLADMNEEGANLLMLQTRQALSTTALKLSSDSAQSILRLF